MTDGEAPRLQRERDWPRAAGLFAVAFWLSVVRPSVLVSVPLLALLLTFPTPRLATFAGVVVAALLAFGGPFTEGLWYAERGWAVLLAGWFVALTLRWPRAAFFPRAAASVAGTLGVVVTLLRVRPGSWQVVEWLVTERMQSAVTAGMNAMMTLGAEDGMTPALLETIQRTVELQARVFPALLGLCSLASLGVAWWVFGRLSQRLTTPLRPVSEFRFNDHLVWVLIVGLILLVAGWGGEWGRAGSNAVVFMGGLYALRGLAVFVFATGGLSVLGGTLLVLATLLVAPLVVPLALFVGVGDTWLNLRARLAR